MDLFTPNTFLTLEQLAEEYSAAMFGTLRNNLHRESPIISDLEFWRRWKRMTLAGIDDIGERQNVTDHRYQTLKRAIDEREGNALIITTNLSIEDIAVKTDDRIASRLAGGTFVRIDGDDMRLQETF